MKVGVFIVGAPKAGTTSLYHYMDNHPEVKMSSKKEPDYFSDRELFNQGLYYGGNRIDTLKKYKKLFLNMKEEKIMCEASVSYLYYPNVANRIKDYNPDAKIVIMLRNPVDRAVSHYLMDYRLGLISNSLENIFYNDSGLYFQQYFLLGKYFNQVKKYIDIFGSENVHIIWHSDFKVNTKLEFEKLVEFIGIKSDCEINFNKIHNSFSMHRNNFVRKIYSFNFLRKFLSFLLPARLVSFIKSILFVKDNKPEISEEIRLKILDFYKPDIENLEQLLSVNLSKWKK